MGLMLHAGHPLMTGHDLATAIMGFVVLGLFVAGVVYSTFYR
jgi:hypothetical protein